MGRLLLRASPWRDDSECRSRKPQSGCRRTKNPDRGKVLRLASCRRLEQVPTPSAVQHVVRQRHTMFSSLPTSAQPQPAAAATSRRCPRPGCRAPCASLRRHDSASAHLGARQHRRGADLAVEPLAAVSTTAAADRAVSLELGSGRSSSSSSSSSVPSRASSNGRLRVAVDVDEGEALAHGRMQHGPLLSHILAHARPTAFQMLLAQCGPSGVLRAANTLLQSLVHQHRLLASSPYSIAPSDPLLPLAPALTQFWAASCTASTSSAWRSMACSTMSLTTTAMTLPRQAGASRCGPLPVDSCGCHSACLGRPVAHRCLPSSCARSAHELSRVCCVLPQQPTRPPREIEISPLPPLRLQIWQCGQDESNHKVHDFFKSHHFAAGIETMPGARPGTPPHCPQRSQMPGRRMQGPSSTAQPQGLGPLLRQRCTRRLCTPAKGNSGMPDPIPLPLAQHTRTHTRTHTSFGLQALTSRCGGCGPPATSWSSPRGSTASRSPH